jgi:uncharacterized protein YlaI
MNNEIEIHICKICGESMSEALCRKHMQETGHDEFKPVANNNQKRAGGAE